MKMTIKLVIETQEAEADELAVAVKNALDEVVMPNGDRLWLAGGVSIVVKDVSA